MKLSIDRRERRRRRQRKSATWHPNVPSAAGYLRDMLADPLPESDEELRRLFSCLRKRYYGTHEKAAAAAATTDHPVMPYRCTHCDGWHLCSVKGEPIAKGA